MNPDAMSPIDWAKRPLQLYADFSGRAPRAEYWWFALAEIVAFLVASILDSILGLHLGGSGIGIFYLIVALGLLIPALAVSVRRLHDTDRSGWWLLIAIIPLIGAIALLVFMLLEGNQEPNRFGPNPYDGAGMSAVPAE